MIDENILPLVEVLNEIDGIQTIGSCQGHPDGIGRNSGNGYRTPYVIFCTTPSLVERLNQSLSDIKLICSWLVEEFNRESNLYSITASKNEDFSLEAAWSDITCISVKLRSLIATVKVQS